MKRSRQERDYNIHINPIKLNELTVGSNLLDTLFEDLSYTPNSPRLPKPIDPVITKENYDIITKPTKSTRMIDIINFSMCDCCCRNKYIIDLNIYYDVKITDSLIKICSSCIERVELISIYCTQKYTLYTSIMKYYLDRSNVDLTSLTCIIPAIIGTKTRYIPVDHTVVNILLKKYNKTTKTRDMKKPELLSYIYDNNPCVSCKKVKNKKIKIYDTLNYICSDCSINCKKERIRMRDFCYTDSYFDIFVDSDRVDMRCYEHSDNHTWIYTPIVLSNKVIEVIPICSRCYLSMLKNPRRIL